MKAGESSGYRGDEPRQLLKILVDGRRRTLATWQPGQEPGHLFQQIVVYMFGPASDDEGFDDERNFADLPSAEDTRDSPDPGTCKPVERCESDCRIGRASRCAQTKNGRLPVGGSSKESRGAIGTGGKGTFHRLDAAPADDLLEDRCHPVGGGKLGHSSPQQIVPNPALESTRATGWGIKTMDPLQRQPGEATS